ncbi:deoxyguanosinetriphosphate triphosphohydrolase [Metallumcola ferriviriculae]|uniref:Deoxyguanosinetriphosphate triphosphohydrolase-like protein n=1 Tax=Metallumcola ferriviriculae TaxID=3039180 RepID=A0AAU0UQ71_9FIRM|nr:deoxyguanosinetriphosphate triphosphohydrolase [Desulfitibacteraceae bacterium MK1]
MNLREQSEKWEHQHLLPNAAFSDRSKGRVRDDEPCPVRTVFQRDRDRIIHCKAFRRLKHKTQVFLAPEGDHFRTRLTHTLEVSQIARTVARALRLNEDLTEAIALGHDLGHTPFGHAGEDALDKVYPGGFEHNRQSLRVVDSLEQGKGLNLTFEVRDGILNHTGPDRPITLEGQIVKIADRIAYINHDIDDAIRAEVIREEQLPRECTAMIGKHHRERINTMVTDMIMNSSDKDRISMSDEVWQATDKLRTFLFENVYIGSPAKAEQDKAVRMLQALYQYYSENPDKLPPGWEQDGASQAACDYIAGMTDRYAIKLYQQLFVPRGYHM